MSGVFDAGLASTLLQFFLNNSVIVLWALGFLFFAGLMFGFASQSL